MPDSDDGPCDRCDGAHATWRCPHFSKGRSSHADAQAMPLSQRPQPGPALPPLRCRGKLRKQPGDGHCVYHSMTRGLRSLGRSVRSAIGYRVELSDWMRPRGGDVVGSATLSDWVRWETGGRFSFGSYLTRMRSACAQQVDVEFWGGSCELVASARKEEASIWLWAPRGGGMYERQHIFRAKVETAPKYHVCRSHGVHYDYLEFKEEDLDAAIATQIGSVFASCAPSAAAALPPSARSAGAACTPVTRAPSCLPGFTGHLHFWNRSNWPRGRRDMLFPAPCVCMCRRLRRPRLRRPLAPQPQLVSM